MLHIARVCIRLPVRQGLRNFSKRADEFNLASKVRILEDTAIKTPRHFERAGTSLQTNEFLKYSQLR